MKNLLILGLFVFGLCFVSNVYAEGDAPAEAKAEKKKRAKKPTPPLEEMTVTGTITKSESKKGEKVRVKYILTDDAGKKITLPKPRKPKKKKGKAAEGEAAEAAPAALNLDDFVDAKVTVVGKGFMKEKKGKKTIFLKQVLKVTKAE